MPKFTVWQCDRCSKQAVQEGAPADWMNADLREARVGNLAKTAERLWCESCWRQIKEPLPQAGKAA